MARVFAAMSGGVDSSVAAALLVAQGHDVVGVTMRLLDEGSPGGCRPSGSERAARLVCGELGIAHHTWDMREVFERDVVADFVDEYACGRTPNPCVRCNDRVKFGELLDRVGRAGGECLATGHYARVVETAAGRRVARGLDPGKDQSYFLYRCTDEQLSRTLFPVGDMTKLEVRRLARRLGLPTAEAGESQDICFVPGGDARAFVRARRPDAFRAGEIVDSGGASLGRHDGVPGLTVGQRKGTGGGSTGRRYVTSVDAGTATVVVGARAELAISVVRAVQPVWHASDGAVRVTAGIRYRGEAAPATARVIDDVLTVEFDEPVSAAAPGQALVCWDGDIVIGGGVIERFA